MFFPENAGMDLTGNLPFTYSGMGEKEGVENPARGKTTEISGNGKGFHGFPRRAVENSVEKLGKYWGVILSNREKAWKIKADRIRGNVENA